VEDISMQQAKPVVVITGSNGLIGSAIAARLKAELTVVGLDLGSQQTDSPVDAFFAFDLTSDESVARRSAARNRVQDRAGSFGDGLAALQTARRTACVRRRSRLRRSRSP
jgi:nucleoside-diphosphate-sugar epimerase